MRFYSFVLKNVARRRVRSTLTVISMALAVGAVVALVGVSSGFERSFMDVYQRQKVDIIVQQRGVKQRLTSVLPAKLGDQIAKIPGVKQINSGLVDFTSMDELGPVGVLVQGWEPDAPLMMALDIQPGGRRLTAADTQARVAGRAAGHQPGQEGRGQDDPLRQRDVHRGRASSRAPPSTRTAAWWCCSRTCSGSWATRAR